MNRNKILNTILPSHEAREIAEDCGYTSEQEGAEFYFNEVYYEGEWYIGDLPKYKQFVKKIEGGNLYYDYGAISLLKIFILRCLLNFIKI